MANQTPDNLHPVQTLARHGKSFYWASLFLGPTLANRAAQLYQFCRYVDDLADGDLPDRHESLDNIRDRLIGSDVAVGPEVEAFLALAVSSDIPARAAVELLDGMLSDQTPTAVSDEAELLRYCHAVAGTVGLMMCRVLNCTESRADSFAIDLGVAMQLSNIARDVLEDAKMGRRYLPASWVDFSPAQIAAATPDCQQQVSQAIAQLLNLSEQYYASAFLGIRLLPFRSRLAIAIALRVYRQIGFVVKRRKLAWWKGRVMVSKSEKVLLSFRSLTDLVPLVVPAHNKHLHEALQGLAGVDPK
jgi:phytoene synthase